MKKRTSDKIKRKKIKESVYGGSEGYKYEPSWYSEARNDADYFLSEYGDKVFKKPLLKRILSKLRRWFYAFRYNRNKGSIR